MSEYKSRTLSSMEGRRSSLIVTTPLFVQTPFGRHQVYRLITTVPACRSPGFQCWEDTRVNIIRVNVSGVHQGRVGCDLVEGWRVGQK